MTTKNRRLRAPVFLCLSRADGQLYSPDGTIFCEQISCTVETRCNAVNTLRGALQTRILPFE
ncbi:hypothetical protein HMPREF1144_4385 [Klebsiella sp. OBRC7]|nr:hypothetical protein HMPREF1144_4385 [Klebsiella sp. OBRC7]